MDFLPTGDLPGKIVHNDFWNGYYTLPAIHTFSDCRYGIEAKEGLDVFKDSTARQKLLELVETVRLNAHKIVSDYLSDFP